MQSLEDDGGDLLGDGGDLLGDGVDLLVDGVDLLGDGVDLIGNGFELLGDGVDLLGFVIVIIIIRPSSNWELGILVDAAQCYCSTCICRQQMLKYDLRPHHTNIIIPTSQQYKNYKTYLMFFELM